MRWPSLAALRVSATALLALPRAEADAERMRALVRWRLLEPDEEWMTDPVTLTAREAALLATARSPGPIVDLLADLVRGKRAGCCATGHVIKFGGALVAARVLALPLERNPWDGAEAMFIIARRAGVPWPPPGAPSKYGEPAPEPEPEPEPAEEAPAPPTATADSLRALLETATGTARLAVARALFPLDREASRAALEVLAREPGMLGASASLTLARRGVAHAVPRALDVVNLAEPHLEETFLAFDAGSGDFQLWPHDGEEDLLALLSNSARPPAPPFLPPGRSWNARRLDEGRMERDWWARRARDTRDYCSAWWAANAEKVTLRDPWLEEVRRPR